MSDFDNVTPFTISNRELLSFLRLASLWPPRLHSPPPQRPRPPIIINEITPRWHNRHPKHYRLLKEWNPVRKNPQQILVFSTSGATWPTGPCWLQDLRGPYLRHWFQHCRTLNFDIHMRNRAVNLAVRAYVQSSKATRRSGKRVSTSSCVDYTWANTVQSVNP